MLDEMQLRWNKEILQGNEWTQKFEAHMEDDYQARLSEGKTRRYRQTATIGGRGQVEVTAHLKTGSHLGKRRFEVYLHSTEAGSYDE
jgi:hypothetical protein